MNVRVRLTPDEIRARIVDVAEEHFRRVGYAKTAVADIADALGMSPANVYRFFPSKLAINEAICLRCMEESHALIHSVAATQRPAAERLEEMMLELHRFNKSRFTSERRIHDMVEVAMQENWNSIEAHFRTVIACVARIIADGVALGEFQPVQDLEATALTVKQAFFSVLHPVAIAQCADRDLEDQTRRIARLAIRALKAPQPSPQSA